MPFRRAFIAILLFKNPEKAATQGTQRTAKDTEETQFT
jgi:hypothetical protein